MGGFGPEPEYCWLLDICGDSEQKKIQQLGISYIFPPWVLKGKMLDGRNNDVLRFYSSGHLAKKYTHGIPCVQLTRFTLKLSWKIPSAPFLNVSEFYEGHCSHFAVYLPTDLMWTVLHSSSPLVLWSAPSCPQPVFTITEKAPTRTFSWLKAPTSAFTFKTLLRHYAKRALTPR